MFAETGNYSEECFCGGEIGCHRRSSLLVSAKLMSSLQAACRKDF